MEKIFKSLLQKQGYKYIGLVNSNKGIWGYAKDGVFHFCTKTLVEVERKELGIDDEIIVFTEIDDKIRILKNGEWCSNYLIIDESNKILEEQSSSKYSSNYQLSRIDSNSIIVGEKYKGNHRYETHQSIIIEGKKDYDYVFTKEINHLFFFSKVYDDFDNVIEGPEEKVYFHIYSNLECIEEETECAFVWKHKNGNAHFFYTKRVGKNKENLEIICSSPSDIYTRTIDYSDLHGNSIDLFKIKLYDDDYLIIPFERDHGILVLSASEQYYNISTNIIDFKYFGLAPHAFSDKIISREYGEPIMGGYKVNGLEFYDVYGNCLELLENPLKSYDRYFVFSIPNKNLFHKIDKLYGVIEIESHKCKRVVIPPVFEKIEDMGQGVFNLFYGDFFEGNHIQHQFLFSSKGGIINATPVDLNYRIRGFLDETIKSDMIVPYNQNGNIGLIYNGETLIDPCLDNVQGFNYIFNRDHMTDRYRELIETYNPKCAIIQKEGKYGIFISGYSSYIGTNIVIPKYDKIECILVTDRSSGRSSITCTYFSLKKDNHVMIISDYDMQFNESCLEKYDWVEAVKWCYWRPIFKVYKNGKVGAIFKSYEGKTDIIPIKYSELTILWVSSNDIYNNYNVLLYCGDGVYYLTGEKRILSEDDYSFLKVDRYFIFKCKNSDEYLFVNLAGVQLETSEIDEEENLLLVNGSLKFDIDKEMFLPERDDEEGGHGYYHDDNWNYERDTYYALGGNDYDRWKEEGGDIDSMMDGLGY